jgi:DNA polymerase-4
MMENVMGKNGLLIWKKANGIDNSPVEPYHERKSISTEHTFDSDSIDVRMMRDLLTAMAEKLAFKLREKQVLTSCIAVKIRYADFDTQSKQVKVPYTAADHHIIRTVHELFEKLYQRRLRIRLIGIRLSELVQGSHQISLFEDTTAIIQLYQAMDRMRSRFGPDAVRRAAGL